MKITEKSFQDLPIANPPPIRPSLSLSPLCPEIYLLPFRIVLLILNPIFTKPPTYPKHCFVTQIASSEISRFLVSFPLSYCIQSTWAHTPLAEAPITHWNELSPTDITNDSQSQQLCDRHSTQTIDRSGSLSHPLHSTSIRYFLLFLLYKGEEKYTSKKVQWQMHAVIYCDIMHNGKRMEAIQISREGSGWTHMAQMLENAF